MTKALRSFCAILLSALLCLVCFPSVSILASDSDVGFYVRAVIPENQIDTRLTYFDLRMEPLQKQTLQVEVVNEQTEEIKVSAKAISASTNVNGVIDYQTPDIRDETLRIPFSQIATVQENTVTIPAGGSRIVHVSVEMPSEVYDGVILGGLVFQKIPQSAVSAPQSVTQGPMIQNVYSYVVGVKLTETNSQVLPDFELFAIEAAAVDYVAAAVHYIRNKEAAIVKDMDLRVDIYKDGGAEPIAHIDRTNIDMAPNSVMELAVTMPGSTISPGEYRSVIRLSLEDKTWEFEDTFIVGAPQARDINDEVLQPRSGLPLWAVLLIVLLAVLVLVLIFLLLCRRRKKDEEPQKRIPDDKSTPSKPRSGST